MVRMSVLRNYPVICGNEQLGLLQNITLDEAQKQVRALIVSCGIRGKRVVLPEDVSSVGDGFILAVQAHRYKRMHEIESCRFVRDSAGLLVGYVTDYAIDEDSLRILAIEMKPGHFAGRLCGYLWMYQYTRPDKQSLELTVPVCMGSELIGVREETETCEYPP